jgi:hypothetical protein
MENANLINCSSCLYFYNFYLCVCVLFNYINLFFSLSLQITFRRPNKLKKAVGVCKLEGVNQVTSAPGQVREYSMGHLSREFAVCVVLRVISMKQFL